MAMRVYLASPYGFTLHGLEHLRGVRRIARDSWRVELLDPWDEGQFDHTWALRTSRKPEAADAWGRIRDAAPGANFKSIRSSDAVVAVLDGTDVDSGVACEIGYAYGIGVPVIGYRSDFRAAGDSIHHTVNIQIEECLKGGICSSWTEVGDRLDAIVAAPVDRHMRAQFPAVVAVAIQGDCPDARYGSRCEACCRTAVYVGVWHLRSPAHRAGYSHAGGRGCTSAPM